MSELIAFIGVGNMGNPMANNLVKAGKKVKVFDVSKKMIEKAKEKKLDIVENLDDLITDEITTREKKEWEPKKLKGMVMWHNDILDVDMRDGEWLILTRTNYIANKVCVRMKEEGYLHWREGTGWSISPNVLNAIELWLKLQRGASVPADLLKPFSKLIDPKYQLPDIPKLNLSLSPSFITACHNGLFLLYFK